MFCIALPQSALSQQWSKECISPTSKVIEISTKIDFEGRAGNLGYRYRHMKSWDEGWHYFSLNLGRGMEGYGLIVCDTDKVRDRFSVSYCAIERLYGTNDNIANATFTTSASTGAERVTLFLAPVGNHSGPVYRGPTYSTEEIVNAFETAVESGC